MSTPGAPERAGLRRKFRPMMRPTAKGKKHKIRGKQSFSWHSTKAIVPSTAGVGG
jgi:hypothetical protein